LAPLFDTSKAASSYVDAKALRSVTDDGLRALLADAVPSRSSIGRG
jgi:hypothetical protein